MSLSADEEDLTLSAGIYTLLLHIHVDKCDWKSALQLMDKAQRDMPRTRHRLWAKGKDKKKFLKRKRARSTKGNLVPLCVSRPLLKYRILVKAKVGESVLMDIQKLQDEGEQCCSLMWHQVALRAGNITQQLTCYKKSITSLLVIPLPWHHFYSITKSWYVSSWMQINHVGNFHEWIPLIKSSNLFSVRPFCFNSRREWTRGSVTILWSPSVITAYFVVLLVVAWKEECAHINTFNSFLQLGPSHILLYGYIRIKG